MQKKEFQRNDILLFLNSLCYEQGQSQRAALQTIHRMYAHIRPARQTRCVVTHIGAAVTPFLASPGRCGERASSFTRGRNGNNPFAAAAPPSLRRRRRRRRRRSLPHQCPQNKRVHETGIFPEPDIVHTPYTCIGAEYGHPYTPSRCLQIAYAAKGEARNRTDSLSSTHMTSSTSE